MAVQVLAKDDLYVLNHCARHLARHVRDARHDFGHLDAGDPRGHVLEAWRFPIVDSYSDGRDHEAGYAFNEVTFVYPTALPAAEREVAVVGSFANLYEPVALRRVRSADEDTAYLAVTVVVPKGEVHTYRFLVDGRLELDPINPQQVVCDNGQTWSRFFTQLCTDPITFERWELAILDRLTSHVLPFRTEEGQRFIERYYHGLDRAARETQYVRAYRLDQPVGVVNYIDKVVAREERHHLDDYRICLELIDALLRRRNPYVEPALMSKEMYVELYDQMATDQVPGWDYTRYQSPRYFLQLLRRHTFTGAFSHPKHGGNAGAAGWAYLESRFRDPETGRTLFDWRRIMERPLGESPDYHG